MHGKNQRRDWMNRKRQRIDGKAVVLVVVVAALFGSVLLPAVNAGFALVAGAGDETEPSFLLAAVIGVLTASFAGVGVAAVFRRSRRDKS